jgi:pre-mRNA-splicing helicase BRR2
VVTGEPVVINATLRRDAGDDDEDDVDEAVIYGKVVCPRYPADKSEGWWLVVGDPNTNTLLSIKRFSFNKDTKVLPSRMAITY